MGILGGQKIKSPGNVMNCPENQYNLFLPIPPGGGVPGGGVGGVKISKVRSISLTVEKIDKKKVYPPTKGGRSGNFRGSKVQETS